MTAWQALDRWLGTPALLGVCVISAGLTVHVALDMARSDGGARASSLDQRAISPDVARRMLLGLGYVPLSDLARRGEVYVAEARYRDGPVRTVVMKARDGVLIGEGPVTGSLRGGSPRAAADE
jgi:hypothetical protein